MDTVKRRRVQSRVKNNWQSKLRAFSVQREKPFPVGKEALIIGVELDAVKSQSLYTFKLGKRVLRFGVYRAEAVQNTAVSRLNVLCPVVYGRLLGGLCRYRQNDRLIDLPLLKLFKQFAHGSPRCGRNVRAVT